jgi:hypothetical protein
MAQDPNFDVHDAAEKLFGLLDVDAPDEDKDEADDEGADEEELDGADSSDSEDDADDDEESLEDDEEEFEESEDDADDVDDEDDDEAPEPAAQTYKVKVDGEEIEVSLDEALSGYMRQQAFTKKTQAVAEERRAAQEAQEGLRAAREQYAAGLQKLEQILQSAAPPEPDWDKVQKGDRAEVQRAALWQKYQKDSEALQKEQQATLQSQQAEFQQELARRREVEMDLLLAQVPEWATDREKAQAEQRQLVEHFNENYGYQPEEIGNIVDHRAIVIMRKAMLYDQLDAKRKGAKPKQKKAPVLEPGAKKPRVTKSKKKSNKARQRLTNTGSIHDAAELLFDLVE